MFKLNNFIKSFIQKQFKKNFVFKKFRKQLKQLTIYSKILLKQFQVVLFDKD